MFANDLLQINIPEQTFKEYVLEFSAVELFYYQMEHESCTNDFLKKLRNHDPNLQLSTLDRHNLKKVSKLDYPCLYVRFMFFDSHFFLNNTYPSSEFICFLIDSHAFVCIAAGL